MKKEKIELKERNNKDTIKTVPLLKTCKNFRRMGEKSSQRYGDFRISEEECRKIIRKYLN